jgi:cation/acetate symporter
VLIYLSPTIQVDVLGKPLAQIEHAWWFVSLRNPAIIAMPLSFGVAILISLLTRETDADATFAAMQHRMLFGPEAATPLSSERKRTAA